MTIEAMPVGVTCNLGCSYCYENKIRDAGNFRPDGYDLAAMKSGLLAQLAGITDSQRRRFTLFGGEALLMPRADLEDILAWADGEQIHVGIQTNGTLLDPETMDLLIQHKVGIGLSIDGPDELNDTRWAGSIEKTRIMTQRSQAALEALCQRKWIPSLIVTLTQVNASPDRLPRLLAWFTAVTRLGIKSIRLHLLEDDHDAVTTSLVLPERDLIGALEGMMALQSAKKARFDLFDEIVRLQRGRDEGVSCVWHGCDPYTTNAVNGIAADGSRQNCPRVETDGIPWRKADTPSHERQLILAATPQADGGCRGCAFFVMCSGHCPGSAVDRDWRLRSAHCGTLKWLFKTTADVLSYLGETPVSMRKDLPTIEAKMLAAWRHGRPVSLRKTLGLPPAAPPTPRPAAPIVTPEAPDDGAPN